MAEEGNTGGEGQPGEGNGAAGAGKTFTQDELDKIVQERVARAKVTPPADYEDLKKAAGELDKIRKANQSELEREQEARTVAERERDDARTAAREARLERQVTTAATKAKAVDPDAVLALLDRSKVTFGADGSISGVDAAVEDLLKAKPYLVDGNRSPGSADGGARGAANAGSDMNVLLRRAAGRA